MENMKSKKHIILAILTLIVIVGIAMTATVGLEFSLSYSENSRLNIFIGEHDIIDEVNLEELFGEAFGEYYEDEGYVYEEDVEEYEYPENRERKEIDLAEIEVIAGEVLEGRTRVQLATLNENVLTITAREISEEQVEEIVNRINEKYNMVINTENDTLIMTESHMRGRNIVKPYMSMTILAVVAVLAYVAIIYRRVGSVKASGVMIGLLSLTAGLHLSVYAITRIPVNRLTMPIGLIIMAGTLVFGIVVLEKMKKEEKRNSQEK